MSGLVLLIALFFLWSIFLNFAISGYNSIFGMSCSQDSDCSGGCNRGLGNKYYIDVPMPGLMVDCAPFVNICKDSKCSALSIEDVQNEQDCKRFLDYGWCMTHLAINLQDKNICAELEEEDKETCFINFDIHAEEYGWN